MELLNKVYITKPSLPSLKELTPYLESIWESKSLTNCGAFHQKLESALCQYLGVEYISLFTNGTIALLTALQALEIRGEVITTPYSFVATSHALLWNNITPVFVDIDPDSKNLDPDKIEAAITEKTTAILPVHCYGHPCDTQNIQKISRKYKIAVIYDAAHAFNVKDEYGSILKHGDLSVLSFHATKVFNTFEGGAVVSSSLKMKNKIDHLKNFGFIDEETISVSGINGKMSEFNAAFGLLQLKYVDNAIKERKKVDFLYKKLLHNISGIECFYSPENIQPNFAYFPILVTGEYHRSRDELYNYLKEHNIYSRKYFWPLISTFSMYKNLPSAQSSNLPIANIISKQILCLPIYPGLELKIVRFICDLIKEKVPFDKSQIPYTSSGLEKLKVETRN